MVSVGPGQFANLRRRRDQLTARRLHMKHSLRRINRELYLIDLELERHASANGRSIDDHTETPA